MGSTDAGSVVPADARAAPVIIQPGGERYSSDSNADILKCPDRPWSVVQSEIHLYAIIPVDPLFSGPGWRARLVYRNAGVDDA
jgi:hypothetical protein